MKFALAVLLLISLNCTSSFSQSLDSLAENTLGRETKESSDVLSYMADSIIFTFQGDPTPLAIRAITISKRNGYQEQLGRAYFAMAGIKRIVNFEFDVSDSYYDSAIQLLKNSNDLSTYGRALYAKAINLGVKIGAGSKKADFEAVKILEKGNELSKTIAKEAHAYYLTQENKRAEAVKILSDAFNTYKKRNNPARALLVLDRIISNKIILGEFSTIDSLSKEYFEIAERHHLNYFIGLHFFKIGKAELEKNNYKYALDHFLKALSYYKKSNPPSYYSTQLCIRIAECYEFFGDITKSKYFRKKALKFASIGEDSNIYEWALNATSSYYIQLGQLDSALYYKQQYIDLINEQLKKRNLHINELEELYRAKETLIKNDKLENELRVQRILVQGSIGVAVLLVIVMLIIYNSRKTIKKINQKLAENNQTMELQNDKLHTLNDKLSDSVSMRDRLLSVLAHDIRGPLNNVKSLIYLKSLNLPEQDLQDIENKIIVSVETTTDLLNNILSWSTIQLNKGESASIESFNVEEVLKDIYKTYSLIAHQKKLQLIIDPSHIANVSVKSDPATLHLVLRNLVHNAIKFTEQGSVIVKSTRVDSEQLLFEVIDTGPGAQEEKIKKILEGKTIGKKSVGTNNEKGSGLGLALCQAYLMKINSHLSYKKNSDNGSIFYFMVTNLN